MPYTYPQAWEVLAAGEVLCDAAHAVVAAVSSFGSQPYRSTGQIHIIVHNQNPLQWYLHMGCLSEHGIMLHLST